MLVTFSHSCAVVKRENAVTDHSKPGEAMRHSPLKCHQTSGASATGVSQRRKAKFTCRGRRDALICQRLVFDFMMAVSLGGGDYGGGCSSDWPRSDDAALLRVVIGGPKLVTVQLPPPAVAAVDTGRFAEMAKTQH